MRIFRVVAAACVGLAAAGWSSFVASATPSVNVPDDASRPHLALSPALVDYITAAIRDKKGKRESGPEHGPGAVTFYTPPTRFRDIYEAGGVLVGFDLSFAMGPLNQPIISAYRPYYLTKMGKRPGDWRGQPGRKFTHLEAKPGYAVGKVTVFSDIYLRNLSVTYMKRTADGLDPTDNYESPCYGGPHLPHSGRPPFGGDGKLIIGLFGALSSDGELAGFGGIVLPPKP